MIHYECDECHQSFKRKEKLQYYIKKTVCIRQNDDIYECKFCQKKFTTSTSMY